MRPINSAYDRMSAESAKAARQLLGGHNVGDILDYKAIEALDDMAWNEHVRPHVEEVLGEGYRIVSLP